MELYQIHDVAAGQLQANHAQWAQTYMLHFSQRIGNPNNARAMAQHYLGWGRDVLRRVRVHITQPSKAGAIVWAAYHEYHVQITLVRLWPGDYHTEKWVKGWKKGYELCPICNPTWARWAAVVPGDVLAQSAVTDLMDLDDEPPPATHMDGYEAFLHQTWRAARALPMTGHLNDDLL